MHTPQQSFNAILRSMAHVFTRIAIYYSHHPKRTLGIVATLIIIPGLLVMNIQARTLVKTYQSLESYTTQDRNGITIAQEYNTKEYFALYLDALPPRFEELLLLKEDRYFRYHLGINPISTARAAMRSFLYSDAGGSSTITQQLTKNLLNNEHHRTVKNKLIELWYTIALELTLTKDEIITMYANTIFMGNQLQGFANASMAYYGKDIEKLNDKEILSLLATLSSPSVTNPWKKPNEEKTTTLEQRFSLSLESLEATISQEDFIHHTNTSFELQTLPPLCTRKQCSSTVDHHLTEKVRAILADHISQSWEQGARNGAIVITKQPENEILAIIGSADPKSLRDGNQINMSTQPRPIGSTVKPFIYLQGFERGLRPYTIADDREYKYSIATGFPLYPKNYDGLYRGEVTLHESLSNSLNVPTVLTLDFVGLDNFYEFLERDLSFEPVSPLETYQLGIALGGLETDLLTLVNYFSVFPNEGALHPLQAYYPQDAIHEPFPPAMHENSPREIGDKAHVQLINAILSDRLTGVEQFGLTGNLNLPVTNYGVKTGTSRDYHDSWTVGYTPDFVVGVWLGNVENKPLKQVSGSVGAGKIWHDVMQVMINSDYYTDTPFQTDRISSTLIDGSLAYTLPGDDIPYHKNILTNPPLILTPHKEDIILLEESTIIPLKATTKVRWYINEVFIGSGKTQEFSPDELGIYTIQAKTETKTETFTISIIDK